MYCNQRGIYKGRSELFEGLDIWKYEEYRNRQGKFPVIFIKKAGIHNFKLTNP